MKIKLIILLSIITTSICSVDRNLASVTYITEQDYENLERKVDIIEDGLQEVRNGQLDYKVEKNLLKEFYSMSYKRINLYITLFLAFIGILGSLGAFNVYSIKKRFDCELKEMIKNKKELDDIIQSQKEYEKNSKENNTKLKVNELHEIVSYALKTENFSYALRKVIDGLKTYENNPTLLYDKALCHTKLKDLSNAISIYEEILKIKPDEIKCITNLIELYILTDNFEKAKILRENNKTAIKEIYLGVIYIYFEVLTECFSKNLSEALNKSKEILQIDELNILPKRRWNVDEVLIELSNNGEAKFFDLLREFTNYMNGKSNLVSYNEFLTDFEKSI